MSAMYQRSCFYLNLFVGLLVVFVPAVASTAEATSAPVVVGLDHIPLAVENLERAAERYRALGFALKPGRPHENGIRNQHAKFLDGTEIELITAPAARDSLTGQYREFLAKGDGPAFAGVYAPALDRAIERLNARDIEHTRNGGMINFPLTSELRYLFIGGRVRSSTDRPEHFAHVNTAETLIGLWLASENPSAERKLFTQLGAKVSVMQVNVPEAMNCPVARFAESDIVFLPLDRQRIAGRRIVGASVRVRSISEVQRVLTANGFEVPAVVATNAGRSIFLPPQLTHGLWLEFRQPLTQLP